MSIYAINKYDQLNEVIHLLLEQAVTSDASQKIATDSLLLKCRTFSILRDQTLKAIHSHLACGDEGLLAINDQGAQVTTLPTIHGQV